VRSSLEGGAKSRTRLLKTLRPALPLPKPEKRKAEIVLRHRPIERNPLAGMFLQRLAIGRNRLLELFRPALALAEAKKRIAEIVLRHRPTERNPLARIFLQRRAKSRNRLLKTLRPALPLPKPHKRSAEIVLGRGPIERPFRTRRESEIVTIEIDRFGERGIVAEFLSLFVQFVRLTGDIFPLLL